MAFGPPGILGGAMAIGRGSTGRLEPTGQKSRFKNLAEDKSSY